MTWYKCCQSFIISKFIWVVLSRVNFICDTVVGHGFTVFFSGWAKMLFEQEKVGKWHLLKRKKRTKLEENGSSFTEVITTHLFFKHILCHQSSFFLLIPFNIAVKLFPPQLHIALAVSLQIRSDHLNTELGKKHSPTDSVCSSLLWKLPPHMNTFIRTGCRREERRLEES